VLKKLLQELAREKERLGARSMEEAISRILQEYRLLRRRVAILEMLEKTGEGEARPPSGSYLKIGGDGGPRGGSPRHLSADRGAGQGEARAIAGPALSLNYISIIRGRGGFTR
jgi:hypothetical protein